MEPSHCSGFGDTHLEEGIGGRCKEVTGDAAGKVAWNSQCRASMLQISGRAFELSLMVSGTTKDS